MFDRRVLKARAKEILKTAYIPILAAVIIQFFSSQIIATLLSVLTNTAALFPAVTPYTIQIIRFVLSMLVSVFVYGPLIVGTTGIILDASRRRTADYSKLLKFFGKGCYLKTVSAMSVRMIISQLLSEQMNILLRLYAFTVLNKRLPSIPDAIPGIAVTGFAVVFIAVMIFLTVKCFDYFLIEYIVADNYDIGLMNALRSTKNYMNGNKFAALLLGLSMTGWFLLGALACGIGSLLVMPYMQAVIVQLYFELKGESVISDGGSPNDNFVNL